MGRAPSPRDQVKAEAAAFRDRNLAIGQAAKPWPGTDAAISAGCECPVIDNGRGRGYQHRPGLDDPDFAVVEGCPLHWAKPKDQ